MALRTVRIMKQSTRDQVPITAQKKLLFAVPPREFQSKFVEKIGTIQGMTTAVKTSIARGNSMMVALTNGLC